MTAGVEGSVDPEEAARDSRRDRRPGVFGDGVPVPSLVDQGVRGEDNVGRMSIASLSQNSHSALSFFFFSLRRLRHPPRCTGYVRCLAAYN